MAILMRCACGKVYKNKAAYEKPLKAEYGGLAGRPLGTPEGEHQYKECQGCKWDCAPFLKDTYTEADTGECRWKEQTAPPKKVEVAYNHDGGVM